MTELGVWRAQSLTADCGGWTKTELHLVRETRGGGLRSLAPAPTQRTTARAQTRAGVTRGLHRLPVPGCRDQEVMADDGR